MESGTKLTDLYVEYAAGITDAPRLYSQWMAYLILSSVINRNVYMRGSFKHLYPNFFFLIVGPSSVYRKSFSQDLAISVIKEIIDDYQFNDVSSREAFVSELAREDRTLPGCGLIAIDEMAGFMGRMKGSVHFQGMIQDLSTIFTGNSLVRRVGISEKEKEVFRVDQPFVNLTAACSFDWLTKAVETSDLTGGFLARFLWIVAADKEGEHWSEERPGDAMIRSRLVTGLKEVRDLLGEMAWTPDAKKRWDSWYSDFRTRNQGGKWDANYERLTVQVKKLAMLNAAQSLRLDITVEDLANAIQITEPLIEKLKDIVIGESKDEITRNKIFALIRRRQLIPRSDILNFIADVDAKSLDNHIKTLVEMEKIEIVTRITGPKNRQTTLYQPKQGVESRPPTNYLAASASFLERGV